MGDWLQWNFLIFQLTGSLLAFSEPHNVPWSFSFKTGFLGLNSWSVNKLKCFGIQGLFLLIFRLQFWFLCWLFVSSLLPFEIVCRFCTTGSSICCQSFLVLYLFQHIITVLLAPSSPVEPCYVRVCGRLLYVFLFLRESHFESFIFYISGLGGIWFFPKCSVSKKCSAG